MESLESLARQGITKTAVWCPMLEEVGIRKAITALQDTGVSAISLCALVLYDPEKFPQSKGATGAESKMPGRRG